MKFPILFKRKPVEEKPDHTHNWELIAKTFVEPKPISIANSLELTQLSMTGMTTFLFQCLECKEFKTE